MKNKFKIFLLALVMSISFALSTGDAYADTTAPKNDTAKIEFATKAPFGKRQLAMKFIMAMLGVAASSVIIYVGLSVYNKLMYGSSHRLVINDDDDDFKTPTNMKDAINIFLKKTK